MVIENKKNGFSLIELLIVVAIIGVLAAIGYPAYTKYVIKTQRVEAQSQMVQIARNLGNYKISNGNYLNASLSNQNIYGGSVFPKDDVANYTFTLVIPNASSWVLTATPIQKRKVDGNGIVVLDSNSQKCWQEGSSTCTLSTTSTWD